MLNYETITSQLIELENFKYLYSTNSPGAFMKYENKVHTLIVFYNTENKITGFWVRDIA